MIYFIEAAGTPWIKVGKSTNPTARLNSLQGGNPFKLRFLHVAEGYGREERRLHAILSMHRGIGEWFHRSAVVPIIRVLRRAGIAGLADIERLRRNEKRQAMAKADALDKIWSVCERRLAAHVLRTIPAEESKLKTRITHRAWRKTVAGQTRLSGHALIHSLSYAPQYFARMVRAQTGRCLARRPVVARYQGIIAEADAMRVPA